VYRVYRVWRGEVLVEPTTVDVRCRPLDGREVLVNVSGAIQLMRGVTAQRRLKDEHSHILSVISHDLKTPLAALKAHAQLLRRLLPTLAHLFERFYRAPPSGAVASGAVPASAWAATCAVLWSSATGGDIGVASTPGKGATFTFTFTLTLIVPLAA